MPFSSTTDNIQLGPCVVYFGTAAAETSLGLTEGGVEVSLTTETKALVTDQYGTTAIKNVVMGNGATVKTPFTEYDLQLFRTIIPGSLLYQSGGGKTKMLFRAAAGTDLLALAKSLLLKKAANNVATTNKNHWVRFVKAAPSGELTFAFSKENQQIFNVTWNCYQASISDSTIAIFGDEDASGAGV